MQYVIIVGNFVSGIQTIHGPFEDKEHANQWAAVNIGKQSYVIHPISI